MAKKKTSNSPGRRAYPRTDDTIARRFDDAGKAYTIGPGRILADLALGRLHVEEKRAVLQLEGEYSAEIVYTAK